MPQLYSLVNSPTPYKIYALGCTIQDYGFTKNGSFLSGSSCNAITSDSIGCRANVYVDTAYGNIHVWFRYKVPGGSYASINSSSINVTSAGTYTFDATIGTLTTSGNYFIDLVQMVPLYCEASGTPNSCRSLNIAAPCVFSTLNIPDISVAVGSTYTLTTSCKDNCNNWINCPPSGFSWSSDNPSVASVINSTTQNTIVTGVNAGTAHITVSNGGITTTNTVTITGGGNNYGCSGSQCLQGYGNLPPGCNNTCTGGGNNYGCSGSQCLQGYGNLPPGCNNTCTGGGGTGCPGCDLTKNICLDSIGLGCQPTSYIYGGVALFFVMMMLKG